ncbi:MAG: hypothetical protein AAFY11_02905 [Cyanobacteria bacterium J06641_5]
MGRLKLRVHRSLGLPGAVRAVLARSPWGVDGTDQWLAGPACPDTTNNKLYAVDRDINVRKHHGRTHHPC